MKKNSPLVSIASYVLLILIYGLPLAICAAPFFFIPGVALKLIGLIIVPVAYAFLFVTVAGVASRPFQKGIIKGVFPRKTSHPIYAMRKLYGLCWTSVYYFKPVYSIILNFPLFKAMTFRLFGYKGSLDFTIYPDAWIRDLKLLKFEEGVYIANRCTLGTNVCTNDGNIIVDSIKIRKNSIIGHLATIGFGVSIGSNTEVGVRCLIGVYCKLGNNVLIGGLAGVGHFTTIGDNTEVGICSIIGKNCTINSNIIIPDYVNIPDNCIINTESDLKSILSKSVYQNAGTSL